MALLLRPASKAAPGPFLGGAAVPPSDRRGRPIPGPGAGTGAGGDAGGRGRCRGPGFPLPCKSWEDTGRGRGASQGQAVTAKPGARLPDSQSLLLQEHSSEI